jgi:hypothetical protein
LISKSNDLANDSDNSAPPLRAEDDDARSEQNNPSVSGLGVESDNTFRSNSNNNGRPPTGDIFMTLSNVNLNRANPLPHTSSEQPVNANSNFQIIPSPKEDIELTNLHTVSSTDQSWR